MAHRLGEAGCAGQVITGPAERLGYFLVASVAEEAGRRVGAAGRVAAVDAVVVEDDRDHRQLVAADRFDLHAAEPEGAVALDRDDGLAGHRGGADRIAHANPHDTPGAAVEPVPG